ncbi:urea ABC transporter permease subunit UrtB [Inhella proteolytica]|uniref:Urea ABC transporter permease subunit UrtB n=1 Tax=Inhella proteolytica TaxID=2795029 RepID=A0A931J5C3_9BURK|nr:urea ABC transporter permease subunit UrtB [Inhella proteolytica]MBH9577829.1 urea ABC transporter permease subunit UrtB [Inhella proteolytica]
MRAGWRVFLLGLALLLGAGPARALSPALQLQLAQGEGDARVAALNQALLAGDRRLGAYLQALLEGRVRIQGDQVRVAAPGEPPATEGEEPMLNNRLRREFENALAALDLLAPEPERRAQALQVLADQPDPARLPLLERARAAETLPALQQQLDRLLAAARLSAAEPAQRLRAAQALAQAADPSTRALLLERLAAETDPTVRRALQQAAQAVAERLAWGERAQLLFSGLSLGSILLLAALGLAITYGLMGVINMAHGELLMIGAYATWGVQQAFRAWLPPGAFDAYLLLALPASFLAAAAVGVLMERLVIRHLYGRPLESLLATWGLSLILMQTVRSLFGAQNVAVENPGVLSGGWALLPNLTLPWNRLAIIGLAALVLLGVALLLTRTRLGLLVRGVTQNRRMAACVGVDTARVDTLAFALGSGLAGLAGCALSQVGNVGPDLGQSTIVDAFMVVVLGGVGQLAGTVYAGLGLGVLAKLLEGWQGAVLAKIGLLLLLILVIQKRPQGLFALKGRSVDA